jgi:hypothetical protein
VSRLRCAQDCNAHTRCDVSIRLDVSAMSERSRAAALPMCIGVDALTRATRLSPTASTAARFKAAYENDVKSLLEGKQLTAKQIATLKGTLGKVDSFVPKTREAAPTASAVPAYSDSWKQHVEDGEWLGLENLTTAHTSGYTLERFVNSQRVHVSVIDQLRDARAAGIAGSSQCRAQAARDTQRMGESVSSDIVSTLTLPGARVTLAPMLAGRRVECTRGTIDSALRQLRRVCQRNGRKPVRNVVRRDYPETRGQKCRRKVGEAIARRKQAIHSDP